MSIKKELENALIERLSAALAREGFKFVKTHNSWYKKTPAATFAFHAGFIQHPTDFDVTADVAVRLESLARLLEGLLGGADAATAVVGRFAVGAEIGNLTIGEQRRWTVASPEDVEPVAASILEPFETAALPYFKEYSNPERVLAVLSGDSPDSWLHAPLHHSRAIRAVALAFLLGQPDKFESLVERKRAFLAARNDPNVHRNLPVFEKVVAQLRDRWEAQDPVNEDG